LEVAESIIERNMDLKKNEQLLPVIVTFMNEKPKFRGAVNNYVNNRRTTKTSEFWIT